MYMDYNKNQIHQLFNESKNWIISYNKDQREYYIHEECTLTLKLTWNFLWFKTFMTNILIVLNQC